jgi:hypothetical protein
MVDKISSELKGTTVAAKKLAKNNPKYPASMIEFYEKGSKNTNYLVQM